MFKAAVVGCGFIAGANDDPDAPGVRSHAKAYRRHGAFGDLGFADTDPDRARELAKRFSGTPFPDAAALMRDLRPDAVSVCVPDDRHFEVLSAVLTAPAPPRIVLAEKPVCGDARQLEELRRMEAAGRSRIIVNHSRRFDEAHRKVRGLIARGSLGPLLRGHVDYYGGFRHLGVHVVDTLQFFFGLPIEPAALRYRCESKYPDDPTLDGTLLLGDAPVTLCGIDESNYQILDIGLLFAAGQVRLTDFGSRVEVLRKSVNEDKENVLVPDPGHSGAGMTAPLAAAVAVCAAYLSSGDPGPLAEFGLDEAAKTMGTLWRGSRLYADQDKKHRPV